MNKTFVKRVLKDFIDLGEIEIKTGPFGTQLHASDYVEQGTPVINVRNIGYGRIKNEKLEYINEETVQRLSSHLLKHNDIVFGRKGAVDRHALIGFDQQEWFQGSDCLRIRIKSESLGPLFLSYYFLTDNHKKWMMAQCSHGATMASLNQDIISRISICLPRIEIQHKIAAILSAYDDLIENNTRRIKILEEMSQTIYNEWFVKFRFPGHENAKMVPSDLGEIPEGWKTRKIGDIFTVVLGGTPSRKREDYWNGNIPWINSGKVNELRIINESEGITELGLKKSATKIMPVRTTVVAITGATLGQISLTEIEVCANQSVVGIYDEKKTYSEYIFLKINEIINEIILKAGGGAQQHINKEIINETEIIIPPKNMVEEFNSDIKPIFNQISILFFKNQNLRKTRDLLLPRLISGEIDVSELDIDVGGITA
ncbi:restriction endonuclease subunit S [Methanosarcina sp.]|uniref:restriction endonuclease subunit S n=1 Tax=Methanosarcina sp. TaxID=2213 RepID=UPI003C77112A